MPYADSGAFGVYVGTTPHQTAQVLELVRSELEKVVADGIKAVMMGAAAERSIREGLPVALSLKSLF